LFTGKGDQAVCFYCGVGLKDWEEMDDPWVEHAVWSAKCIHVVLIKGQAFIEECHRLKEARTQVEVGLIPFYGYTGMVLFNSCVPTVLQISFLFGVLHVIVRVSDSPDINSLDLFAIFSKPGLILNGQKLHKCTLTSRHDDRSLLNFVFQTFGV
jgi:hypothetical protein